MRCLFLLFIAFVLVLLILSYLSGVSVIVKSSSFYDVKIGGLSEKVYLPNTCRVDVTTLDYSGQQGAGVQALLSLQCFFGHLSFPANVIEPAIIATKLTGSMFEETLTLGDLFDLNYFNSVSSSHGYAEIISRDDFVQHNLKNVIYICTVGRCKEWPTSDSIGNCYPMATNSLLRGLQQIGYCVVKVVNINYRSLSVERIEDILRELSEDIIIVFNKWKGLWVSHERCDTVKDMFFNVPFDPSPRLLKAAMSYENLYLKSKKYLAIMMRVEHALLNSRKLSLKKCLGDVIRIAKEIQVKGGYGLPMVAADIGKYGSHSWDDEIKNITSKIIAEQQAINALKTLLDNRINFRQWEESFLSVSDGITNEGYIAAIQRTIASRAQCLVLMGGGHFQGLALKDYLHYWDKASWCVYFVCMDDKKFVKDVVNKASHRNDSDSVKNE